MLDNLGFEKWVASYQTYRSNNKLKAITPSELVAWNSDWDSWKLARRLKEQEQINSHNVISHKK